jgi:hypothetical protein
VEFATAETALSRRLPNVVKRLAHEQRFVTGDEVTGSKRILEV